MSFDHVAHLSQPLQAGLWHDGLEYGSNELLERAPGLSLGLTRGRLAWSGGGGPAGRVLKRINQRLEQQDHQEMRKHPGFGRSVVDAGRLFQTDQTLEPFEPQFYPPSQSIERQHIVGEECVVTQRGDNDEPTGGIQRFPRRGVAGLAPLLTDLPSCGPAFAGAGSQLRPLVCGWRPNAEPEGDRSCGGSGSAGRSDRWPETV